MKVKPNKISQRISIDENSTWYLSRGSKFYPLDTDPKNYISSFDSDGSVFGTGNIKNNMLNHLYRSWELPDFGSMQLLYIDLIHKYLISLVFISRAILKQIYQKYIDMLSLRIFCNLLSLFKGKNLYLYTNNVLEQSSTASLVWQLPYAMS